MWISMNENFLKIQIYPFEDRSRGEEERDKRESGWLMNREEEKNIHGTFRF